MVRLRFSEDRRTSRGPRSFQQLKQPQQEKEKQIEKKSAIVAVGCRIMSYISMTICSCASKTTTWGARRQRWMGLYLLMTLGAIEASWISSEAFE